jgi:adenylylsulfate kinase-like enzyme
LPFLPGSPYFIMTKQSADRSVMSGKTIWITGLSGAGKSTTAVIVVEKLRKAGEPVVFLDGDELRAVFGNQGVTGASMTREGREELAMRYARLCKMLSDQGLTVVIATISLMHSIHAWNRENLTNYLEVFLDVPVDELRRRDPKGIYDRFDRGETNNVSGLDLAVDYPENPDLRLSWGDGLSADEASDRICEAAHDPRWTEPG